MMRLPSKPQIIAYVAVIDTITASILVPPPRMVPNANKGSNKLKVSIEVVDGVFICVCHESRIYNDTCSSCTPIQAGLLRSLRCH